MRRALAFLVALAGCGRGGETYVSIEVASPSALPGLARVDLSSSLGGVTRMRTLSPVASLPVSAGYRIATGSGRFMVTATAFDAAGTPLATGMASGDVTRGETLVLRVTLGAELADGGPDGAPADAAPADAALDGNSDSALLTLDRMSTNFGPIARGATSPPVTFTVTNTGALQSGSLSASVTGTGMAAFQLDAAGCAGRRLSQNESCQIMIRYAPSAVTTDSAMLLVSAAPGGSVQSSLTGTGIPGTLEIAPAALDFGGVVMGQMSGALSLTVTNTGAVTTGTLVTTLAGADMAHFALETDGCAGQTLAQAASCTIALRFRPTLTGARAATLSVTGSPGGSVQATLAGNGLTPGTLSITPGGHDFGMVNQGSPSATQQFTVMNSGPGSTGNLGVQLTGTHAAEFMLTGGNCQGLALGPGASCTVEARLLPSSGGSKSASLMVTASPGGSAVAQLSGQGIGPAVLALPTSPPPIGSTVINTSIDGTLLLQNVGQTASGALSINVTGTDASQFTLPTPGGSECVAGTALAAGASCPVRVRFRPTSQGGKSALLVISAAPGGTTMAPLTGNGQNQAALTVSPGAHDFGLIEVGQQSAPFVFTIGNSGDVPTGVPSLTMGGDFPATTTCGAMLDAGSTCTVSVRFAPSAGGMRTAQHSVGATPGGTVNLSVSGVGGFRLTVSPSGPGTGVVTGTGLSCGADCDEIYPAGTLVTITAATMNGTDSFFGGWGSGGCNSFVKVCTLTMSQARTVTLSFSTMVNNLAFVTSGVHPTNRAMGVTGYDMDCNAAATLHGINNAGGTAYVSWTSVSGNPAATRLGTTARGWVRLDGKPFADTKANLMSGRILNPLRISESGVDRGNVLVHTGTLSSGAAATTNCTGWTGVGTSTVGTTAGGPERWTNLSTTAACTGGSSMRPIYCLGTSKTVALVAAPTSGKFIYLSNDVWDNSSGSGALDLFCRSSKPAGSGLTHKAMIATSTTAGSSALTAATLYVRPDGQVVGTGSEISAGTLRSGIWQSGDGTYVSPLVAGTAVWTGTLAGVSGVGMLDSTCANWGDPLGGSATIGDFTRVDAVFYNNGTALACADSTARIFCVEQ